jgi:hypothetical protein
MAERATVGLHHLVRGSDRVRKHVEGVDGIVEDCAVEAALAHYRFGGGNSPAAVSTTSVAGRHSAENRSDEQQGESPYAPLSRGATISTPLETLALPSR